MEKGNKIQIFDERVMLAIVTARVSCKGQETGLRLRGAVLQHGEHASKQQKQSINQTYLNYKWLALL